MKTFSCFIFGVLLLFVLVEPVQAYIDPGTGSMLVQGMLDATAEDNSVGQLIFDINGEYANDNPQDGNKSIRSANAERCDVYALTKRSETPSKPLRCRCR